MTILLPLLALVALSSYGLYLSYHNITRLVTYQAKAEKAAKWSNTAAHRLHKTRTTQASGTIALVVSLLSTLYLFASSPWHNTSVAVVNMLLTFCARMHMAAFWNEGTQVQVPFVEKFNEAVKGSEQVVKLLPLACAAWAGVGILGFFGMDGIMAQGWFLVGTAAGWVLLQGESQAEGNVQVSK